MLKFRKVFNFKLISLLVAGVFLLNTSVYGIDLPNKSHLRTHLLGNSDEGNIRFKKALIYGILGQVVKAEKKNDLTLYGEEKKALLLENGKILLEEELYNKYYSNNLEDNKEALQVIIHEIIESLLQVTSQTNPYRYQSIKEIALNNLATLYFKTPQSSTIYRDEILANDIWAVIFEHRLMGINPEDIKDSNLTRLLREGRATR